MLCSRDSGTYDVRYPDGCQAVFSRQGDEVCWEPGPDLSPGEVEAWLVGPVLGLALRFRGALVLHASAISLDGRSAIAFVGANGAGKSTLAAAFALRGFRVLSDNLLALESTSGGPTAWPSFPQIRLWPDSVARLFGREDALPRVSSEPATWDKRYYDLASVYSPDPLPLSRLYLLEPRQDCSSAATITATGASAALVDLVRNTFASNLFDPAMQAAALKQAATVLGTVPVRRLACQTEPGMLPRVCDEILLDSAPDSVSWPLPGFPAQPAGALPGASSPP